ncbi:DNA alkylation repair protein [Alkalilimnicola ehrlichii]|uniref:DNA alkylation repair protein n=1 Tax=Alkalilimnicola ehrlichii TaxID=351052 RepID=A0A3E0WIA4_9GAMM|nr:DNA alkylation repair protein [Alkalilimnicola ehrlichii]RFA26614.1 DNA alkylation repair protein [Alkalilimnicola ehrlichii]RFA31891.1 DNA alkylation repair protein [Alkalilimnicola ehrlichii]
MNAPNKRTNTRKGATRTADIPADILDALSHGKMQTATLTEGLALDQAKLLRAAFPGLSPRALAAADDACQLGIVKRMAGIGAVLLEELGTEGIKQCSEHDADTVRGWACFMIGTQTELALPSRLEAIQPLADDAHFGVREWSWMAVRPHLARELDEAIAYLTAWAVSPSERLRRFASEALRPRGVWCAHITPLKQQPERALPILSSLRADPSTYVQDSVANWLNDAGKDKPEWVRGLCQKWLQGEPSAATRRICQRALRNLK